MGMKLCTCFEPQLSETQLEETIFNRYEYLKCTFDHYVLRTSKNKVKLLHTYVENQYDYNGIQMLCEKGAKLKTIGDLIQLLCYVPEQYPCLCYPISNIFQDYEIKHKEGMMKVRHKHKWNHKNKYSTYNKLLWHDYAWQNHFFYKPDEKSFFEIPFMTTCAILEIMNLEYNSFSNKDWKRQDFESFLEDCNSIDIPIAFLNKLLTWTMIHQDNMLINYRQSLQDPSSSSFLSDQYKKQLQFMTYMKRLFIVDM